MSIKISAIVVAMVLFGSVMTAEGGVPPMFGFADFMNAGVVVSHSQRMEKYEYSYQAPRGGCSDELGWRYMSCGKGNRCTWACFIETPAEFQKRRVAEAIKIYQNAADEFRKQGKPEIAEMYERTIQAIRSQQ